MNQPLLEERVTAAQHEVTKIEHEAVFDVTVQITGSSHTISIDEGIQVVYDLQKLEENPPEYIYRLTKNEESFLYAIKDLPEHASHELKRLRARNGQFVSTSRSGFVIGVWRIMYLPFKPFTKKSLEEQLYNSQVQYYENMMHDYIFLQSLFSEGTEMVEHYLRRAEQITLEQREETGKCIILGRKITNLYEDLHTLSKLRKTEKERWFYHYFPEQRGNFPQHRG